MPVFGLKSLHDVIEFLKDGKRELPFQIDVHAAMRENSVYEDDFVGVKGQEHAKRAFEVAAAGGHNMLTM